MLEITVTSLAFPCWQARFVNHYTIAAGLLMVAVGQTVRSIAMAQAGTNFNHIPARQKKEGHELVTWGIYAWLRHPSYFGYFWFAVGTQLVVGNKICGLAYALILWKFFSSRIESKFSRMRERIALLLTVMQTRKDFCWNSLEKTM